MADPVVHIDVPTTLDRYGLAGDITANLDRVSEHHHASNTGALHY